jgi:hypothetical protein
MVVKELRFLLHPNRKDPHLHNRNIILITTNIQDTKYIQYTIHVYMANNKIIIIYSYIRFLQLQNRIDSSIL